MARKLDPERIYASRRAAVFSILTGSGCRENRAEAHVRPGRRTLPPRADSGSPRHSRDEDTEWIAERRSGARKG